jgi:outer membrane protein assembly factor BamB
MNKNVAIAIVLILMLSMSAAMATAMAQLNTYTSSPSQTNGLWNYPTWPGLTVSPDPVGVGQTVQVIILIELLPPSYGIEAVTGTYGGWKGIVLTVTDPNGTATTMGPYETDVSGTYQLSYTPTKVGTYYFQFTFPGQADDAATARITYGHYVGYFMPSTSPKISLNVQQAPVSGYSEAPIPLPGQWYTYPINAQNRDWNRISGPWLQTGFNATGSFNPYTYAPNSAHIAWKKQYYAMTAGLGGGDYLSLQVPGTENSVNSGVSSPIIMEGRMYYNGPIVPAANGTIQNFWYCADLQTGQVLWQVPGSITCGQIVDWRTQQMHSALPYLWYISTGQYKMWSAVDGELQAEWHNLPSGTAVANSTTVAAVFGGVTFTPTVINHAINVLSGTIVLEKPNPYWIGQNIGGAGGGGALLIYIYGRNTNQPTGWLACWNSTLAIDSIDNNVVDWPPGASQGSFNAGIGYGVNGIGGGPASATYWPAIALQQTIMPLNWEWGIMWNLTVPLVSTNDAQGNNVAAAWSLTGVDTNYAILQTGRSYPNYTGTNYRTLAAINIASQPMTTKLAVSTVISSYGVPYQIGGDYQVPTPATFAWIENYTMPPYSQSAGTATLKNDGNILITDSSLECIWSIDETTGALKWKSTPFANDFIMQSMNVGTVAYGMEYIAAYDGYMHAINTTTGVQMWQTPSQSGGLEMPQPYYPMSGGAVVADHKVYTTTAKSYEQQPLFRGHKLLCYDANTGAPLWNISGQIPVTAIACGYLLGVNAYDGCLYAFHSGPTATTVTAPMTAVTAGSSCVIGGTVTDQTPGSLQGTPAISDDWMSAWMEYMYMDQPYPSHATGVTVSIDAVDPNNNFIHIGTATSDITGAFGYVWTPPDVPGKYTIIATFAGSNSYYSSSGEATAVVSQPVAATAPPAAPVPIDYTMTIIAGVIAIMIVVVIVGVILYLRLGKRP